METLKKRQADLLDQKFDQAKSVGGNLAAGADVFQVMAGTLQNILRVVVEAINKAPKIFGGGTETSQKLRDEFKAAKNAQKDYEVQIEKGRRKRNPGRAGAV